MQCTFTSRTNISKQTDLSLYNVVSLLHIYFFNNIIINFGNIVITTLHVRLPCSIIPGPHKFPLTYLISNIFNDTLNSVELIIKI